MSEPLKKPGCQPEGYDPREVPEIVKMAEQARQGDSYPETIETEKTTMTENYIKHVKPLQQFMEDGSFLMPEIPALFRAVQALGAPEYIDYDYLLSVSGMAVRLAWQQGWAAYEGLPNQAIFLDGKYGWSVIELAMARVGMKYTIKTVAETGIEAARRDIKDSIDKGVPVLINEPFVFAAVLGYDESGFYGVSSHADTGKRLPPHDYNLMEDWPNQCISYILLDEYAPRDMDAALLTDTLRTAVHLARTTRSECHGDTALGLASFDALAEMMVWDEGFEPLDSNKNAKKNKHYEGELSFPYERPEGYYRTDGARTLHDRFWAGYCDFLCMLNGYENFARFLDKYADLLPAHSERLRESAKHYAAANVYSGALWQYVTPDDKGVAKFKKKEVRYAFAAHMLRAKIFTVKAVEILEGILAKEDLE